MQIHRNILIGLGLTFVVIFLCIKLISSTFDALGVDGPSTVCNKQPELNCTLVSLSWQVSEKKTFAHTKIKAPAKRHDDVIAAFKELERRSANAVFSPGYRVELVLIDSEPAEKTLKPNKKHKKGEQKNV